ncbi:MAG: cell division protein SepF [Streptococcaceae bacterium]|jgi:cell division inhibitor SepF|nr:cell division protein SepF [Streptococcaceae bacterium]
MALRDQFNRLRNYFVEDDEEEDYDYEEAPLREEAPVSQPVAREEISSRQQPQQQPVQPQRGVRPSQMAEQPTYRRNVEGTANSAQQTYRSQAPQPQAVTPRQTLTPSTNMSINIKDPHAYPEIMEIGGLVKGGQSVLVNFKNMQELNARRSIDFLTGIAYCIDGDIQNIGGQIFLVTPTGVTVEGAKESILASGNFESLEY